MELNRIDVEYRILKQELQKYAIKIQELNQQAESQEVKTMELQGSLEQALKKPNKSDTKKNNP